MVCPREESWARDIYGYGLVMAIWSSKVNQGFIGAWMSYRASMGRRGLGDLGSEGGLIDGLLHCS
jgi:hypothetical protein